MIDTSIFWQIGLDSTAVLPLSNVFPSRRFQAMDRLLFAGLLVLSVSSFTAHASSSRPHIIFILADDLVSTTNNFQTECPGFLYKSSCMRSEGNWKAHNVHFSHLFWPVFLAFILGYLTYCCGLIGGAFFQSPEFDFL